MQPQIHNEAFYQEALQQLQAEAQLRNCKPFTPTQHAGVGVLVDQAGMINFCSNNYLGLQDDPRLKQAAIEAIETDGIGSGASRLVSGTSHRVQALEIALAQFKHTEAALVFNSGYQANVAILQAVLGAGDWVFSDKLNHASLVDGCLLSGARWARYRHLDLNHLEALLKKAPAQAKKWIITDSVFSMDGDQADLRAWVELAEKYNAYTLVDEAHATGLFGDKRSSGLCEDYQVSDRVTLQMGTFSKALGGFGAYVAGSQVMMDYLVNKARGFIYSTALPPGVIAAAHEAIQIVQTDPQPKKQLWDNVARFQQACVQHNLPILASSHIIPFVLGSSQPTMNAGQQLLEAGFFVQGIRPPTVPVGTARLRITLSAAHQPEQIDALVGALKTITIEP